MLWGLRAGCLAVAAGAAVVVFLVLGNVAQPTLGLHRLREPSLVLWGGLALFVLLHPAPVTHWHRWRARLGAALDHPACYPAIAGVMLAVFLTSAASRHLAFYTGSHDFSMIDEALYQSHRGRLLYSPVLERSFLSEHFSPILLLLIPLHALAPTPWLLVLAQPVVLWASGLLLRATLVEAGVAGGIANLALLAYLNHSGLVSALEFPVHMESALPLLVLALYRAARRGRLVSCWAAATLALAVKEDVGLYLAGFGAWLALAERRRRLGIATAAAGLAWTLLATQWVIPAFAPPGGVGFRPRSVEPLGPGPARHPDRDGHAPARAGRGAPRTGGDPTVRGPALPPLRDPLGRALGARPVGR